MLTRLFIENYALIDQLNLDFNKGFTVITGETGAGKSILLGALSLVLGKRAEITEISKSGNKCIVEAYFNIKNYKLNPFFDENELDYDDTLIIRREITTNGKSRAFINDTPVPLNILKLLTEKLVDIHSQNKTITLTDADLQLSVIDSFAQQDTLLTEYAELFNSHKLLKNKLQQIENENRQAKADIDYTQFLFDELSASALNNDEQEELENELETLTHADIIISTLQNATYQLYEADSNVISKTNSVISSLKNIVKYNTNISNILSRLENITIELKDICSEIEKIISTVNSDPERMAFVSERLDLIYKLQTKHRVNSIAELNEIMLQLKEKLEKVCFNDEEIIKLKNESEKLWEKIIEKTKIIHNNREKVIPEIENEIVSLLKELAMPDAIFKIELKSDTQYNINGNDKIRFLFSANKGTEPHEIGKIASGGELSRLMLAVKSTISGKNLIPTLFFDEIDTGVSGETAGKVGTIMKKMSADMQLIAITHLPQIAAMADFHLNVVKEIKNEKPVTRIFYLKSEERINEIARLLSNEKITDAAKMTAKELLNFN